MAAWKISTDQSAGSTKHPVEKNQPDHVVEPSLVQALQSSADLREPGESGPEIDELPDDVPEAPVEVDKQNECASLTVTLLSRNQSDKTKIKLSDKCAEEGWAIDPLSKPQCTRDRFPMNCSFPAVLEDVPRPGYPKEKKVMSLAEMQDLVNHTYEMSKLKFHYGISATKKGKRDKQYQWAAKAMQKEMHVPDGCKPATVGKPPGRVLDCDVCWAWFVPHPCRCRCRKHWTQVTLLCFEDCSVRGAYTHDTGLYCHKPCDRDGQFHLRTGCGAGEVRKCVKNTGACVADIFNKVVAIGEVLLNIGTAGAFKAISAGAKAAETSIKAGLALVKAAMKASAKALAKRLMKRGTIKNKLKKLGKEHQEDILEGGAELFMSQSMPADIGGALLEIAAIIDPTGVTGVVEAFMPGPSCDDSAYFDEPLPGEEGNFPLYGVMDPCRVSAENCVKSMTDKWKAQPGKCHNSGHYTHCKFGQSLQWRRHEMATYSSGVAAAREFCLRDAETFGASGAQTALLWGWQYCFMFFPPGKSCPAALKEYSGFYQEWVPSNFDKDKALEFGGDEANYNYCMIGPKDEDKKEKNKKDDRRRRRAKSRRRRR